MNIVAIIMQGGQQQIHKLNLRVDRPLVIGRSWQSDIVIDDQFIDGSHMNLSIDEGGLTITDLDSQNGVQIAKKQIIESSLYQQGELIRIGDSSLKIFDADSTVQPAKPFDSAHAFARCFKSLGSILAATLLAVLAVFVSLYFQSATEATSERVIGALFGFGVMLFIWSVLAGFIGKLFRHETNVSLHWVFNCLLTAVVIFLGFFVDILSFNFDSDWASMLLEYALIFLAFGVFIYGSLSLATRLNKRRKLVIASIISLIPVLVMFGSPLLKEEHTLWSYRPDIHKSTLPTQYFLRQSTSLNKHIEGLDDLFAELDEEVEASVAEQ